VDVYGEALRRMVAAVGDAARAELCRDPLVRALLTLHGLHREDLAARVEDALTQVRPYLASHAGGVRLSSVDPDGVVHLELEGSCGGCPSSTETAREVIERAIAEVAPDVASVQFEARGPTEERGTLVQLGRAPRGSGAARLAHDVAHAYTEETTVRRSS
jgi:Fe-S cluster biogenesis protein NfuA